MAVVGDIVGCRVQGLEILQLFSIQAELAESVAESGRICLGKSCASFDWLCLDEVEFLCHLLLFGSCCIGIIFFLNECLCFCQSMFRKFNTLLLFSGSFVLLLLFLLLFRQNWFGSLLLCLRIILWELVGEHAECFFSIWVHSDFRAELEQNSSLFQIVKHFAQVTHVTSFHVGTSSFDLFNDFFGLCLCCCVSSFCSLGCFR
jgi:hypothetical protein